MSKNHIDEYENNPNFTIKKKSFGIFDHLDYSSEDDEKEVEYQITPVIIESKISDFNKEQKLNNEEEEEKEEFEEQKENIVEVKKIKPSPTKMKDYIEKILDLNNKETFEKDIKEGNNMLKYYLFYLL